MIAPDAVVVGAGPAGCLAAIALARAGGRVLLVDKQRFPRPKVCGGCLGPGAVRTLRALGLSSVGPLGRAPSLSGLRVHAGRASVLIEVDAGVAVARDELDAALVRAAGHAGVEVRTGATARLLPGAAGGVRTVVIDGEPVRARAVVAADGLGGTLLAGHAGFEVEVDRGGKLGVGALVERAPAWLRVGEVVMVCGRAGYAGAVALGDGRAVVAAALGVEACRSGGGPGAVIGELWRSAGLEPVAASRWSGTPRLSRRRRRVAGERVFVVGDAAGYSEPFTGEGMTWAMLEGLAVAPWVMRCVGDASAEAALETEAGWEREWRASHDGGRRRASLIGRVLDRPGLTRVLVSLSSVWPGLRDRLGAWAAKGATA